MDFLRGPPQGRCAGHERDARQDGGGERVARRVDDEMQDAVDLISIFQVRCLPLFCLVRPTLLSRHFNHYAFGPRLCAWFRRQRKTAAEKFIEFMSRS